MRSRVVQEVGPVGVGLRVDQEGRGRAADDNASFSRADGWATGLHEAEGEELREREPQQPRADAVVATGKPGTQSYACKPRHRRGAELLAVPSWKYTNLMWSSDLERGVAGPNFSPRAF